MATERDYTTDALSAGIEREDRIPPFQEWLDSLPEGDEPALFEESLAAKYPLIHRECPFNE